jgi:glycosyltransferase involved in cell wall biosynthesis
VQPAPQEADRPRRLVGASGDPTRPLTQSGRAYFLLHHGRHAGMFDGPATRTLRTRSVRWAGWNVGHVLLGRGGGGYRFTPRQIDRLFLPVPDGPTTIVNCTQLYPRRLLEAPDVRRWYFLDQTLSQLFEGYTAQLHLSRGVADAAIEAERECYAAAHHIVAVSDWARAAIVERYGIAPERVSVVKQAANFTSEGYADWLARYETAPRPPSDDLRLVFVGQDWHRKGLDRLLGALAIVNQPRRRVVLDVIGTDQSAVPRELAETPAVRWHGFLSKPGDERRFLDVISGADVGCLLSRAEAASNAIREFHSVGLAVLCTDVGGPSEQMAPHAGWIVGVDERDDQIAARLAELHDHRDRVDDAQRAAWDHRAEMLWDRALGDFQALFDRLGG